MAERSEKALAAAAASRRRGARHFGEAWSELENAVIRKMRARDALAPAIAAELPGRTPQAVRHQISKLGLKPLRKGSLAKVYTPAKVRKAVRLKGQGLTHEQIIARLGGKSKGTLSGVLKKAREQRAAKGAAP